MRQICTRILGLLLAGIVLHGPGFAGSVPPDSGGLYRCDSIFALLEAELPKSGHEARTMALAEQLADAARKAGSLKFMGRALYVKGRVIASGEKRTEGRDMIQSAVQMMEAARDSEYLPRALYSIAAVEYLMEDLDDAQRDAQKAVEAAKSIQDTSLLMLSINIFALIQKELGNFQAAIDYLEEGIEQMSERGKYYLMQNLGVIYKEKGDLDKAHTCFSRVAAHYEEIGLTTELGIALNNLGTVALRRHDPESALAYLNQAQGKIANGSSLKLNALIRMNMGVARSDLGNCMQAVEDFVAAREALSRLKERKNLGLALENEADCRFQLGEYKIAYLLLDSAKVIGDSLADEGRAETIAELEQKYRQKSQKQRIEDLKKENAIILERNSAKDASAKSQRIALILLLVLIGMLVVLGIGVFRFQRVRFQRRTESDKQLLLRQQIKPHFIFNAMNSIQHFLLHDRKKEGLIYLGKFGELLRSILNNSEKDLVSIADELKLIRYYLDMEQVRTNDKFDYEIKVAPDIDPEEIYMPGMVLQMLVENAIWHGVAQKEERGKIQVLVHRQNGHIEVAVRDDGVGLFHKNPGKVLPRKSFGLELVRQRVRGLSWNRVSFQFDLNEEKDENGKVLGTLARIIMFGKIPI